MPCVDPPVSHAGRPTRSATSTGRRVNEATHSLSAHASLGLQPAHEWVLAALTHAAIIAGLQNLLC